MPTQAASSRTSEAPGAGAPFDTERLDALMDEAGIDVVIASSKHNLQYLLGGYRFFFFSHQDAIGVSRYLPLFLYFKGEPERSVYVGNAMEKWERDLGSLWTPEIETATWGTADAIVRAAAHLRALGKARPRIAVERAFLPADAEGALREALPQAEIVDALVPLERLRARKTPAEIALMREASERVVDAMLAVMTGTPPGRTKREIVEALRREEVTRGLEFEYCLITAGTSLNRAPSDAVWGEGDILSLDSGGTYHGYIGDLCRMAVQGEPDAELEDLLAEVDTIQQAARKPVRAGVLGGEVLIAADTAIAAAPHHAILDFAAHGVGFILHEAPRLRGGVPVPYPSEDAERPLEEGMIVSIETALLHPKRGFIKLEDNVVVTKDGCDPLGDRGRGWNRGLSG